MGISCFDNTRIISAPLQDCVLLLLPSILLITWVQMADRLRCIVELGHWYDENLDVAEILIDNGLTVDAKDNDGKTPLYVACKNGRLELVQLLLSRGAHLTFESLNVASTRNHLEVVWFLVRRSPWLFSELFE